MKALQASKVDGGEIQLAIAELPKPSIKPGYVLVKMVASLINPSDVINSKGGFPNTVFPRVMGRDFAGIVVEPKSSPLMGQEIFGTSGPHQAFDEDGAHAEFLLVKEEGVAVKPKNISFVQASSLGTPFTTASLLLKRAGTKPSETVMITGATGSVGGAAVQLAMQMGCKVLTVSRRDESSINSKTDPELKTAKDLTDGRGPDVAADTVGDTNLLNAAMKSLALGGRLSFISTGKSASPELTVDLKNMYRNNQSLIGSNSVKFTQEELAKYLTEMVPMFETGELKASEDKSFTLVSIEDAIKAYADAGKPGVGKQVIYFPTE